MASRREISAVLAMALAMAMALAIALAMERWRMCSERGEAAAVRTCSPSSPTSAITTAQLLRRSATRVCVRASTFSVSVVLREAV